MIRFNFHKYKYGKELLIDCFSVSEIARKSLAMEEIHTTSFYEMFFFSKVSGQIMLEGKHLPLQGATSLLLSPGQPRKWQIKEQPLGMVVIFEREFLETFLKDTQFLHRLYYFGNYDAPPYLKYTDLELTGLLELMDRIKYEIDHLLTDSYHLLRSYLYQLLILVNRSYAAYHQITGNLYRNTELLKFRDLLRQHIPEKQTVKEYAELMQINRNRLNVLCQETFGKNALAIIQGEILKSCKAALLTTSKTIAEISYDHNFSAPSNFTRFFKALTKLSPAAYRNKYAN